MNPFDLPWVEVAVLAPLLGAVPVRFVRRTDTAWSVSLAVTGLALVAGVMAWVAVLLGKAPPTHSLSMELLSRPFLTVDRLSGPLLPLVALLHFLTILTTARVKMNRMSFTGHLVGESIRLATFACAEPWPLIVLLTLDVVPPYLELLWRKKPTRLYLLHMVLFVGMLIVGWAAQMAGATWAPTVLMLAILVRSGTFPMHLWVADLVKNATFGTALLFATPLVGVYAALRLVMPVAAEWVLEWIGIASLVTAVYAAGLAVVQTDARRFFACLFLSHSALVLVGLELHTASSMAGALGLWLSAAVALTGLGQVLRALEARHGTLSFTQFRGFYDQTPELAVGFLLMGLSCVGFPGTLGFIATEVLVDGVLEANPLIGGAVLVATALNGIAIIRVYLLLFTGQRFRAAVPVPVTGRERWAMLALAAIVIGGGMVPQPLLADRRRAAGDISATFHPSGEPHTGSPSGPR